LWLFDAPPQAPLWLHAHHILQIPPQKASETICGMSKERWEPTHHTAFMFPEALGGHPLFISSAEKEFHAKVGPFNDACSNSWD
jgi:hypothetical protein